MNLAAVYNLKLSFTFHEPNTGLNLVQKSAERIRK